MEGKTNCSAVFLFDYPTEPGVCEELQIATRLRVDFGRLYCGRGCGTDMMVGD